MDYVAGPVRLVGVIGRKRENHIVAKVLAAIPGAYYVLVAVAAGCDCCECAIDE